MNIYKNYYRNLVQENRQILYSLLLPDTEDEEFNSILASKLKSKGSPAENRDFLSILLNEIMQEHENDSPEIRRFKSLFEESLISTKDSDLEFFFWFLGDMGNHISALEGHEEEFQNSSRRASNSSKSRKRGQKSSRKKSTRKTKALKAKNERSKGNQ
jgi:hypothetical protein